MRNSKLKNIGLATMALSFVPLTGCATIIKGIHQPVSITSSPSGALILVDGEEKGHTPAVVKMWRGRSHTIEIHKDGYEEFSRGLAKESSGWIWGNIFIGGLVGLVVDLATQASNDLVPGTVHADLETIAHGASAAPTGPTLLERSYDWRLSAAPPPSGQPPSVMPLVGG